MTTKGEERIKIAIKEHFDDQQRQVSDNFSNIFLFGVAAGVVLSYTNLLSIFVGLTIGYSLGKKQIPLIDYYVLKFNNIINYNRLPFSSTSITENIM